MVNYRRNFIPGGTYFFTVALQDRRSDTLVRNIQALRTAFRETQRKRPFVIEAIVVLPEHLHTIWTLPPDDADYPGRWRAIKSRFTRDFANQGVEPGKRSDGSLLVWQSRYWEHTIRNEADLNRHVDYIHYNPVKHGWVERVADWPYSSFHEYVRRGVLPDTWGTGAIADLNSGEPEAE